MYTILKHFPPLFGQRHLPELKAAQPHALRADCKPELIVGKSRERVRCPCSPSYTCRKALTTDTWEAGLHCECHQSLPMGTLTRTQHGLSAPAGSVTSRETMCNETNFTRGQLTGTVGLLQPHHHCSTSKGLPHARTHVRWELTVVRSRCFRVWYSAAWTHTRGGPSSQHSV